MVAARQDRRGGGDSHRRRERPALRQEWAAGFGLREKSLPEWFGFTLAHGPFLARAMMPATMMPATMMALRSEARRPSYGSRRRKLSKFITASQAKNLLNALNFAEHVGLRLNVAIDIFWLMFLGFADDRTRIARCQERLSKWCKRHGFPLTWLWVREIGKNGGLHVHILMHVPPWFMENGEFQSALERALEPEGGPSSREGDSDPAGIRATGQAPLQPQRTPSARGEAVWRAAFVSGRPFGEACWLHREHRHKSQEGGFTREVDVTLMHEGQSSS